MMFCLPSTVLLVILVLRDNELAYGYLNEEFIKTYVDGKYDSRFLLFHRGLGPSRTYGDWVLQGDRDFSAMGELREMWGSKEPTFWERGLRMVEERRAGLRDQL
ncbi:hypothetical protein DL96DRAFT_1643294 [Flagelloscypha sp. PMI_526]|nr:hypothetical protein DL96DRAFT_1643294 [Flagelloscypha sp. PMI_526]